MNTRETLTRLAEVQADPPNPPVHEIPEWVMELQRRGLVSWDDTGPAYRPTPAGELALAAWRLGQMRVKYVPTACGCCNCCDCGRP